MGVKPVKIFFCYAHEDEALLKKLKMHLRPLEREGLIDVWHDRDINAGSEWKQEISKRLNEAQIILLLVSPDFMGSDYCYGIEMKRAMERHERGDAQVIPVMLRHVYWQSAPFGKLQALPTDAIPVLSSKWHTLDEAFYDVAEGIRIAVKEINEQYPSLGEERVKENEQKAYLPFLSPREPLEMPEGIVSRGVIDFFSGEYSCIPLRNTGTGIAINIHALLCNQQSAACYKVPIPIEPGEIKDLLYIGGTWPSSLTMKEIKGHPLIPLDSDSIYLAITCQDIFSNIPFYLYSFTSFFRSPAAWKLEAFEQDGGKSINEVMLQLHYPNGFPRGTFNATSW